MLVSDVRYSFYFKSNFPQLNPFLFKPFIVHVIIFVETKVVLLQKYNISKRTTLLQTEQ